MLSVLFVGHSYHNSTSSSNFFQSFLGERFSVEKLDIDPEAGSYESGLAGIDLSRIDFVVLWQIDWLARYFLSKGMKTIIVPMYDSSAELSLEHWQVMRGGFFINFSFDLHRKISEAGCESIYVKYAPALSELSENFKVTSPSSTDVRAFFWERRPDSEINLPAVCSLLGGSITHLHVHQAPDPGGISSKVPSGLPFSISTSTWFKSKNDFLDIVANSHIYVAPRYSEGIGMGFLEAMGMGKLVVAHDMPTHNEYIENNHNGILFNAFRGDVVSIGYQRIGEIGANAKVTYQRVLDDWEAWYKPMLLGKIDDYLKTETREFGVVGIKQLKGLCAAHKDWGLYYSTLRAILDFEDGLIESDGLMLMPRIQDEERRGNSLEVLRILDQAIEMHGENSPYCLFKSLYLGRCKEQTTN